MSRNFYILAATLGFFGLLALLISALPLGFSANGALWRSIALLILLVALIAAFIGVMTRIFEGVDRRHSDRNQIDRQARRAQRKANPNHKAENNSEYSNE